MTLINRSMLTFGQLSLWRSIEHFFPEQMKGAVLRPGWSLREGVAAGDVRTALEALEERHESLRTRYRLDLGRDLEQLVHATEPADVEVQEGGADAAALAQRVSGELGDAPLDLAVDKPWRGPPVPPAGGAGVPPPPGPP